MRTSLSLHVCFLCSGRSPASLTLELLEEHGFNEANPPPPLHAYNVTVPGAAAGWCDAIALYGSKKVNPERMSWFERTV